MGYIQHRKVLIYCWINPIDGKPVYVGATCTSLDYRTKNHLRFARLNIKSPFYDWLREILVQGLMPKVVILTETTVAKSALIEDRWIRKISQRFKLYNRAKATGVQPHSRMLDNLEKSGAFKMLGKIPDSKVAKIAGISKQAVCKERKRQGILPVHSRMLEKDQRNGVALQWPLEAIKLLGVVQDSEISRKFGIHISTVCVERSRRKIPTAPAPIFFEWTEEAEAMLGVYKDNIIAEKYGISRQYVGSERRKRGIEPPPTLQGKHRLEAITRNISPIDCDMV